MPSRYSVLGIVLILVTATASVAGFIYISAAMSPGQKGIKVIHIPIGSGIPPGNWHNFTDLSSPSFQYPVNITVVVGVNNTIEWINDDRIAHTVTSFQTPPGASTFNSGIFSQGQTFTVTLTVPGVYKYFCAWHNWLAGVITVKPA